MQCSFHKGDGFFPGTGDEDDIGEQLGRGFSINVPLKVCCACASVLAPLCLRLLHRVCLCVPAFCSETDAHGNEACGAFYPS